MSYKQSTTTPSSAIWEYWLPGYELSKQIVYSQLPLLLGPRATVRPYCYQGREGYLIVGTQLTKAQVADLKWRSKEYERQQTMRMAGRNMTVEGVSDDADISSIVIVNNPRRSAPSYNSEPSNTPRMGYTSSARRGPYSYERRGM